MGTWLSPLTSGHVTSLVYRERVYSPKHRLLRFIDVYSKLLQTAHEQYRFRLESENAKCGFGRIISQGCGMGSWGIHTISVPCNNTTTWRGCPVEAHHQHKFNVALAGTVIYWFLSTLDYR